MINQGKKRLLIMFRILFIRNTRKRTDYIKNKHIFKEFGDHCEWHSKSLPSEPELIEIHNNVHVSANVRFITHDIIHNMFDNVSEYKKFLVYGNDRFEPYKCGIVIHDNVVIGADSTILYGVNIGKNTIIAAGSIVTKDVEPGTIVGGNPAKVIGNVEDLAKKRAVIPNT